jgi:DNA polymerase sigma
VHIEEMIVNVRECVHSLWPQSKVETFGSYSTGIWLPSSDVDLVVLVRLSYRYGIAVLSVFSPLQTRFCWCPGRCRSD